MTRRILITGAASGIGAATARRLAGPGTALALHTRARKAPLEAVAEEVRAAGGAATTLLGDLTEAGTAESLIDDAQRELGGLDALVCNAGFADATPFSALNDAVMDRSFQAITRSFAALAGAARPALEQARAARIVAVSSFVAHRFQLDGAHLPASAAAKAGLEALVRALAVELAGQGVTVNAVVPGYVEKDDQAERALDEAAFQRAVARIPLRRLGRPDDIAAMIAFLLSADAGYVTGQCLHVNGGLTL